MSIGKYAPAAVRPLVVVILAAVLGGCSGAGQRSG